MLNYIPVIGWLLSLFLSCSLAVPFWVIWSVMGLGEKYFYWLPEVYHSVPFWDCVGLFMIIGILKCVLPTKLASVNNTNNPEKDDTK